MKIAFIHPRYPSADGTGATYSATQIASGLASAGHDVYVYCTHRPQTNDCWDSSNIKIRYLDANRKFSHTNTQLNKEILDRYQEFREFDIVHSYLMRLIPSMAKVGKSDVGTIVTLNAYGGTCAKNDLRYMDQMDCRNKSTIKCLKCIARSGGSTSESGYLYQTASRILTLRLIKNGEKQTEYIDAFQALSPHVKKRYGEFGYDTNKITVIPNIVDENFDIPNESGFEEPFQLLYVGSLKKSKGVDRLVTILSRLHKRSNKKPRLTIIGSGNMKQVIQEQIDAQKLGAFVDLRGHVPNNELPNVYAEHDLFIYPGRWNEPFGRIFLEAMSTGTPIVATDVGNVENIIGKAGIVTSQNTRSLVDGIRSVLDTKILREYSRAGKLQIDAYRASQVIPQFELLYSKIIKK